MLSSPLYGRNSKVFSKILTNRVESAPKLSQRLLERFINQTDGPTDVYEPGNDKVGNGSLVLSLASGLWNILTLGYGGPPTDTSEQGLDEVLWSKKPLSDLSLLLLLLLINHSSSDNPTETNSEDHCYRSALYNCYSHKGDRSNKNFLNIGGNNQY